MSRPSLELAFYTATIAPLHDCADRFRERYRIVDKGIWFTSDRPNVSAYPNRASVYALTLYFASHDDAVSFLSDPDAMAIYLEMCG